MPAFVATKIASSRLEPNGTSLGVEGRRDEPPSDVHAPARDDVADGLRREPFGGRGGDVVRREIAAAVARPVGCSGRDGEEERGAGDDHQTSQLPVHEHRQSHVS